MQRGRIFGYDVDGYLWPIEVAGENLQTDDPVYLRWVIISAGHCGQCRRPVVQARAILRLVEADSPWLLRAWRDLVTVVCRLVYAVGVRAGVW